MEQGGKKWRDNLNDWLDKVQDSLEQEGPGARLKNKTLATWLGLLGGPLGLDRFYLYGWYDWVGWLIQIPTTLAIWGFMRSDQYGTDDRLSWALIPLLGFTVAFCCGFAIYHGLMLTPKWNARHNAQSAPDAFPGQSNWLTICGVVLSLLIGAGSLMASFVYALQRFYQFRM